MIRLHSGKLINRGIIVSMKVLSVKKSWDFKKLLSLILFGLFIAGSGGALADTVKLKADHPDK